MPRLIHPSQQPSVEMTLACQSDLPEADRIVWTARALSSADAVKYMARLAEIDKLSTLAERSEAINTLITSIATAWNVTDEASVPMPLDSNSLDQLPFEHKFQFACQLPSAAGWAATAQDKKRLAVTGE